MSAVDARPVDPRDERWELWHPDYRVYFWSQPWGPEGAQASREFELTAPDVLAVLEWAGEHRRADETTYTIFAVVDDVHSGRGLVRLAGDDPTRSV